MIINKITLGWVWQSFDTDTKQYTEQRFVAGDDVAYEENDGNIAPSISEAIDNPVEPYLPFEMVQPVMRNPTNGLTPAEQSAKLALWGVKDRR